MDAQAAWRILGKDMFIRPNTSRSLLVAALALPFTQAVAGDDHAFLPLKASHVIGMDVEDADGQMIGKLNDFVLDTQAGRLKYVLLTSGGFLGISAKLRAVPPQLLSAATAKRGIVALSVPKARWRNAPTIKRTQVASLAEPVRESEISRYYGPIASDTRMAEAGGTHEPLAPTGRESAERRRSVSRMISLKLASELIGADIYDQRQEKLGQVLDLLVNFSPEAPVFVVFSAGKLFKDREHDYAAPLRDFRFMEGKMRVQAERRQFIQAQPFGPSVWKAAETNSGASVYRYSRGERSSASGPASAMNVGWQNISQQKTEQSDC